MKILVKVRPNAKENSIEPAGNNQFSVRIKAKPKQGQANQAVIEVLAEHFDISKSSITLLKGQTSRHKIFVIKEPER